jgi:hypothetical protein
MPGVKVDRHSTFRNVAFTFLIVSMFFSARWYIISNPYITPAIFYMNSFVVICKEMQDGSLTSLMATIASDAFSFILFVYVTPLVCSVASK